MLLMPPTTRFHPDFLVAFYLKQLLGVNTILIEAMRRHLCLTRDAWKRVEEALRARVRETAGRKVAPSAAIIDNQPVKTIEKGAAEL